MISSTQTKLGIGLYTPEDAAFYARVHTRLLNRWLFGDARGEAVLRPQVFAANDKERVVTFLDLVQALAIRSIRAEWKIPLQKIRAAVETARSTFGVDYPFAMEHTTYLVSDQKRSGHGEIVIRIKGFDDHDDSFVQISGKARGNLVMREVVEIYMEDLQFGTEGGIAESWRPLIVRNDSVLLNPHRRFGEPIIESCGYTAQTLWEGSISEGGIGCAAEAFGVPIQAVSLACRYYDYLKSTAV